MLCLIRRSTLQSSIQVGEVDTFSTRRVDAMSCRGRPLVTHFTGITLNKVGRHLATRRRVYFICELQAALWISTFPLPPAHFPKVARLQDFIAVYLLPNLHRSSNPSRTRLLLPRQFVLQKSTWRQTFKTLLSCWSQRWILPSTGKVTCVPRGSRCPED